MNISNFIIILLILIIVWIIYNNQHENMNTINKQKVYDDGTYRDYGTYGLDKTDKIKSWYHYTNRMTNNNKIYDTGDDNMITNLTFHNDYNGKQLINHHIKPSCKTKYIVSDGFRESNNFAKEYIKEKVLDNSIKFNLLSDKGQSLHTRKEICDYQDDFFEFRDKIYASSDPAIDAVDKVNLITLENGFNADNMTIADVYDKLVG